MPTLLRLLSIPLVIMLVQTLAVWGYLSFEKSFAFWDYAMYAQMAQRLFAQSGLSEMWALFAQGLTQKYNYLFTLPSVASFAVFGPSRETFILTNAVVYFAAYQAALSFFLRRAFGWPWQRALLFGFALPALVPFLWYPLVQGYPDHGAAALLLFAVGLGVQSRIGWKKAVGIGVLLALAVAFRRHYAYPALAVVLSFALLDLGVFLRGEWKSRRNIFAFYATMGGAGFVALLAIEPHYLLTILTTDYLTLYKPYERPPLYVLAFIADHVGFVLCAAVVAGYGLTWRLRPAMREGLLLPITLTGLWLGLWALGPAQAGQHYLIAVLPFFVMTGLAALFAHPLPRLWRISLLLFLIANTAQAFWPTDQFVPPNNTPSPSLFSAARPPWVREDYNELLALGRYVRDTTTQQDRIALVGSSFVWNQDLIRAVLMDGLADLRTPVRFVPVPEMDGDDTHLDAIARASVFLIGTPTQFHLDSARQSVLTSATALFPPKDEWASLFKKDDRSFSLARETEITVWRRTKDWAPGALHAALKASRALYPTSRKWVALRSQGPAPFTKGPNGADAVWAVLGGQEGPISLFHDNPYPAPIERLPVTIHGPSRCPLPTLRFAWRDATGHTATEKASTPLLFGAPFYVVLPQINTRGGPFFLSLDITLSSPLSCPVLIELPL